MNARHWISIIVGVVCGLLSTHVLDIGWLNIPLWAAAGLILGWFISEKREVIWCGVFYGFFLSVTFLFSGFQGTSDKLVIFTLFSLALSIVGIAGGIISLYIGNWLHKFFV